MKPTSGKYMFPESSDEDSVDSDDDETSAAARKRREREKLRSRSVALSIFSAGSTAGKGNRESGRSEMDGQRGPLDNENEDGLFLIDSTGGAGKMAVKDQAEKQNRTYTQLDPGFDLTKDLYIDLSCLTRLPAKKAVQGNEEKGVSKKTDMITEMMKKATFKPSLEKNPSLPLVSRNELKRRRKAEREKTKGADWFNLPATEMTEERKRDLEIMQLRDVLDTKSRYKKDDRAVLPKYFQIGTVVEDPTDFYHSRIPRKERKRTIVDELLADAEFQRRSKRKYTEILQEKTRHGGKMGRGDKKKRKRKSKAS